VLTQRLILFENDRVEISISLARLHQNGSNGAARTMTFMVQG